MAPCRTRTVANDPGGRRTYSGVCAAGQAAGKPVLPVDYAHPGQPWKLRIFTASQRFLKPGGLKDGGSGAIEMAGATKKREARKSLHQPGWITLDGGFAARPCVVQDLSATGAKITIADSSFLSGNLRLAFARDARTGRNCEVVWRRGKSFGVKFVR
jgi:hypothetical protein